MEKEVDWVPPVYEKTETERAALKQVFSVNLLTKRLTEEDMSTLIMATQMRAIKTGEILIQFGDVGEEYFILESGCVECKVFDADTKELCATKTIQEGAAFGELALLYNAPRSATITALTDCHVWVLD